MPFDNVMRQLARCPACISLAALRILAPRGLWASEAQLMPVRARMTPSSGGWKRSWPGTHHLGIDNSGIYDSAPTLNH